MNETIKDIQPHINSFEKNIESIKESYIKLQILNEMNLKLYEEMLSVIKKMAGDKS